MSKRKRHQITCTCNAYKFPHRFGGGKCSIERHLTELFESGTHLSTCRNCLLFIQSEHSCEVIQKRESYRYCPIIQDLTNEHEVNL